MFSASEGNVKRVGGYSESWFSLINDSERYCSTSSFIVIPFCIAVILRSVRIFSSILTANCTLLIVSACGFPLVSLILTPPTLCIYLYIFSYIYINNYLTNYYIKIVNYLYNYKHKIVCREEGHSSRLCKLKIRGNYFFYPFPGTPQPKGLGES